MKTPAQRTIRRAQSADADAIKGLLTEARLPTEDFDSAIKLQFWVYEEGGVLLGTIGLERHADGGLLRSLVVATSHRHRGVGTRLVAQLEHDSQSEGVGQLVLLTQTSEPLFHRLGYLVVDRKNVPDGLKQTAEFSSLCPATAVCMTKFLS